MECRSVAGEYTFERFTFNCAQLLTSEVVVIFQFF
jgi:hypothetical protein